MRSLDVDGDPEILDAVKDSAADAFVGELAKPALDQIGDVPFAVDP